MHQSKFSSSNRTIIVLLFAFIAGIIILSLLWFFASPVSLYTTSQCLFKAYHPIDDYTKTGIDFPSVSAVINHHNGGGFSSSKLPTDKATSHSYHIFYDRVLLPYKKLQQQENQQNQETQQQFRLLEIGVKKGGSIILMREFFEYSAMIYGADVDPTITNFPRDPNIKTLVIDSTDTSEVVQSFGEVSKTISKNNNDNNTDRKHNKMKPLDFDVIIDDGCHTLTCIASTFENFYPRLKNTGVYIIEDYPGYYLKDEFRAAFSPHVMLAGDIDDGRKICVEKDKPSSGEFIVFVYPAGSKAGQLEKCKPQFLP